MTEEAVSRGDESLARCVDVARTYGAGPRALVAVHGVTCTITATDSIALVGPSGCGKSTLLHLLAGLEVPTVGAVTWPATGHSPWGRPTEVGVVFQGLSLLPYLDVVENVAFPLILDGLSAIAARDQAMAGLDLLGLAGLARALPDTLSGGQAQRVAIARVLVARPALILADEPTGQLDGATGAHVIDVLLQAVADVGAAVLVTTHDPRVAARFERTWRMADGRILGDRSDGRPGDDRAGDPPLDGRAVDRRGTVRSERVA